MGNAEPIRCLDGCLTRLFQGVFDVRAAQFQAEISGAKKEGKEGKVVPN